MHLPRFHHATTENGDADEWRRAAEEDVGQEMAGCRRLFNLTEKPLTNHIDVALRELSHHELSRLVDAYDRARIEVQLCAGRNRVLGKV